MKVRKEQIRMLLPGNVLVLHCDTAGELDSAYETAKQVKREPFDITIKRSSVTMTVTITRN